MMSVLTKDNRFEEAVNTAAEGEEVKNMRDVLDYVEKRGEERGEKRGEKQGEMKKAKETAINMKARGFSNEDISDLVGVDLEMVKKWFLDELATVS